MSDETTKQDKLLETTDYLEAVGTLKSTKNFFFFLSILSLLILQSCFWLMFFGYVDTFDNSSQCGANVSVAVVSGAGDTGLIQLAAPVAAASAETDKVDEIAAVAVAEKAEKIEQIAGALTADPNAVVDSEAVVQSSAKKVKINFGYIEWLVQFCNFILIISTTIYSLTLLFALKVSLIGRLGGISHITRAFLTSIFALVFLLPWQYAFGDVISGAIYTSGELLSDCIRCGAECGLAKISMFGRFVGLPLVVIVLLMSAQLKSMRWARNILRRLGIAG